MRTLLMIVTLSALCASSVARAQSTLIIHPSPLRCENLLSMANHGMPVLLNRVASTNRQVVTTDNALVIDAEAPAGLIVDECSKTPKVTFASEIARRSDSVHFDNSTYH
ncbi:hypothetical protein PPGU19_091920 (plasmid) [Paraburkholderia sp. PGU19]|uniref:HdeA/HdeB family chaperone n=1 Tax=Paraburkholderia sp. PGU19 TaxID=2735434 RepID=UPI0015DA7AB3|nr:hypothetical protein [Paraburkholderia sp. PGU19]BCG04624.1 hypothetical protein PPGU19_091920 [Paraburkholderia sp. PGU19]